jgi:hypothetical protein
MSNLAICIECNTASFSPSDLSVGRFLSFQSIDSCSIALERATQLATHFDFVVCLFPMYLYRSIRLQNIKLISSQIEFCFQVFDAIRHSIRHRFDCDTNA